jgi:hypothetical protein
LQSNNLSRDNTSQVLIQPSLLSRYSNITIKNISSQTDLAAPTTSNIDVAVTDNLD